MHHVLYHTFADCKCQLCHALQVDAVQRKLSAQQQHLHAQAKEERNRLQQQVQHELVHFSSQPRIQCLRNNLSYGWLALRAASQATAYYQLCKKLFCHSQTVLVSPCSA